MKGLVIKEYWLNKIFDQINPKDWEVRGTNTTIRGRIYLLQSGSGMIVGEADLVDTLPLNIRKFEDNMHRHQIPSWNQVPYKQPWAWVFQNIKKYTQPVPYNHPQGAVIWVNVGDTKDEEVNN